MQESIGIAVACIVKDRTMSSAGFYLFPRAVGWCWVYNKRMNIDIEAI